MDGWEKVLGADIGRDEITSSLALRALWRQYVSLLSHDQASWQITPRRIPVAAAKTKDEALIALGSSTELYSVSEERGLMMEDLMKE